MRRRRTVGERTWFTIISLVIIMSLVYICSNLLRCSWLWVVTRATRQQMQRADKAVPPGGGYILPHEITKGLRSGVAASWLKEANQAYDLDASLQRWWPRAGPSSRAPLRKSCRAGLRRSRLVATVTQPQGSERRRTDGWVDEKVTG